MPTQLINPAEKLPSAQTGHAPFTVLDGGAGDPQIPALLFDAASDEEAQFQLDSSEYSSGNITIGIRYSMATATTGNVVWNAQIMAYTPDDAVDLVTDTWATANTVTDAVPGTAGYMTEAVITLSNLDSIADEDYVILRIVRDADNASDTAAGDAELVQVRVTYT